MIKSVLVMAYLIICFSSEGQHSDSLVWKEDWRLTWNHFRGVPDTVTRAEFTGRLAKAVTATGLVMVPVSFDNGCWCYKMQAVFYPDQSWKRTESDRLLAHEQLHFDILELMIRKLRCQVNELKNKLQISDFELLQLNILQEENELQKSFDSATHHGTIYSQQLLWNERIRKELEELKEYGEEVLICPKSK